MKNFLKAILIALIDVFVWWCIILGAIYVINVVSKSTALMILGVIIFILTFLFAYFLLLPDPEEGKVKNDKENEIIKDIEKELDEIDEK